MPSLTARRKPAKPKPWPPVPVDGYFLAKPTTDELLAGTAVLQIDRPEDTNDWYWCQYVCDAYTVVGYELRKFGTGSVYFLPADCSDCDCPDRVYRGRACKHMTAMRQALGLGVRP
jgi:hypothetical protein